MPTPLSPGFLGDDLGALPVAPSRQLGAHDLGRSLKTALSQFSKTDSWPIYRDDFLAHLTTVNPVLVAVLLGARPPANGRIAESSSLLQQQLSATLTVVMKFHPTAATRLRNLRRSDAFAAADTPGTLAWDQLCTHLDRRGVARTVRHLLALQQPQSPSEDQGAFTQRMLNSNHELNDSPISLHSNVLHENVLVVATLVGMHNTVARDTILSALDAADTRAGDISYNRMCDMMHRHPTTPDNKPARTGQDVAAFAAAMHTQMHSQAEAAVVAAMARPTTRRLVACMSFSCARSDTRPLECRVIAAVQSLCLMLYHTDPMLGPDFHPTDYEGVLPEAAWPTIGACFRQAVDSDQFEFDLHAGVPFQPPTGPSVHTDRGAEPSWSADSPGTPDGDSMPPPAWAFPAAAGFLSVFCGKAAAPLPVATSGMFLVDGGANICMEPDASRFRAYSPLITPVPCSGSGVDILGFGSIDISVVYTDGVSRPLTVRAAHAPGMTARGAPTILSQEYLRREHGVSFSYHVRRAPSATDSHGSQVLTMVNDLPFLTGGHAESPGTAPPSACLAYKGRARFLLGVIDHYSNYIWLAALSSKRDIITQLRLILLQIRTICSKAGQRRFAPSIKFDCYPNYLITACRSMALAGKYHKEWRASIVSELRSLRARNTFAYARLPVGRHAIGNKWVFKFKANSDGSVSRFKARLVAQVFSQQAGVDYHATFSPVVKLSTLRTCLAVAAARGMRIHQIDIETAFLNAFLKEGIYMRQPKGAEDGTDNVLRLLKSIYGLKQASREWNELTHKTLTGLGVARSNSDTSMYNMNHPRYGICIVLVYVDDILVVSDSVDWIRDADKAPLSREDHETYRAILGSANFLTMCTRPDLAFAISVLSRFQSAPQKIDLMQLKLSGDISMLNGDVIGWNSKQQETTTLSTIEAEYVALSRAAQNTVHYTQLLQDIHQQQQGPTVVYEDNQGAVKLAKNTMASHRTKHIDIKHHYC
eukprot:jgi/Tetstr1/459167/TSEL_004613.t1